MGFKGLFAPNLRKKVITVFFVISIVPIVIILFVNYNESRKNLETEIEKALFAVATAKKDNIEELIKLRQEQVLTIVNNPKNQSLLRQINQGSPDSLEIKKELSVYQQHIIKHVKAFSAIFLTDANGQIVGSTNENNIGRDESGSNVFINGKEGLYIKDFYFDSGSEKKRLEYSIAAPMVDEVTNAFLGVVVVRIFIASLLQFISRKYSRCYNLKKLY